jgi:beta-N-acetylhexosaminidase
VTRGGYTRRQLLAGLSFAAAVAGLDACRAAPTPAPSNQGTPVPTPSGQGQPASPASDAALRRKIASLLVVGFRGQTAGPDDWIVKAIRDEGLGGVILFDRDQITGTVRNISSPPQVTSLVRTLRAASAGRLIVSIDQEGGKVARLNPSNGFPATRSEAEIGAANSSATTRAWAQEIAHMLSSSGFTFNFAPVVDLNVNPSNPAIGKLGRSFSANADVVVANATEEIQSHRAVGVRTSLKHFPGFGSATGNTDFGVVDVTATWRPAELEPFRRLIASGMADVVMVAHLLNRQLDPTRPASLSPDVVTGLLRGQLGWTGPVVSDDMQAVAISSRYGPAQAVTMAIEAGVDLLVFANQQTFDPNIVTQTVDSIANLVRSGHITEARIDESVARVNTIRPAN